MIDGIIKYNLAYKKSAPLRENRFLGIEAVRKRLVALGFIGVYTNGVGYGNISQRARGDAFVITGTQTGHLKNLDANHYALIEEFNDKRFYLRSSGAIKPSSEALTHGTIYNLSSQINAVIHIHSKGIWNYMLQSGFLKTGIVEYGTVEMIDEVNRIYKDRNPLSNPKFVMSGHSEGVMFFGKDLEEAERTLLEVVGLFVERPSNPN